MRSAGEMWFGTELEGPEVVLHLRSHVQTSIRLWQNKSVRIDNFLTQALSGLLVTNVCLHSFKISLFADLLYVLSVEFSLKIINENYLLIY